MRIVSGGISFWERVGLGGLNNLSGGVILGKVVGRGMGMDMFLMMRS